MTLLVEDHQVTICNAARPPHGPPGLYTSELGEKILGEIARGRTLHDVCQDDGIPAYTTVQGWAARNRDGFAARLVNARAIGRAVRRRAPVYPAGTEARILDELANGRPLCDICLADDMPASSTVKLWLKQDRDGFAARYKRAREIGRPRRGGNPTLYTAELAERLLFELAEGRTLSDVCRDDGMPDRSTVRLWVLEDREGFAKRYNDARVFGYHMLIDEILEIADDGRNDWMERRRKGGKTAVVFNRENVRRSRLRTNVRCWLLSNALPKIHGPIDLKNI